MSFSIGFTNTDEIKNMIALVGDRDDDFAKNILNKIFLSITTHNYSDIMPIFQSLLNDSRIDVNYSTFYNTVIYNKVEMVELLLKDSRVELLNDTRNPIASAAMNGHTKLVKLLLADGRLDPALYDNYAIIIASQYGRVDIVKLLLADPRVDPTTKNNKAMRRAVENNHVEMIKLLIPRVDLSTIKDERILKIAKKMNKTKDDAMKKINELMEKHQINGVFRNDQGDLSIISNSQIISMKIQ